MSAISNKFSVRVRVNEQIRVPEVRLIDKSGRQVGVVSIQDALRQAETDDLDLVEISPQSDPPVCRIMDYGKYLFAVQKKQAAAKKKQKQIQVKEIKLRPTTEEGDYQVKLRNLIRFLENGDKAKVTLRFKGREVMYQELGMQILKRIKADLEPYATVEVEPKQEGRLQIMMVLAPKQKKK